jgi:hypothetical protein
MTMLNALLLMGSAMAISLMPATLGKLAQTHR